jgi:hypothetical protein
MNTGLQGFLLEGVSRKAENNVPTASIFMKNSHYIFSDGFYDLTAATMRRKVCCVIIQCSSERGQRFTKTYCLHLQGRRVSQVRNQKMEIICFSETSDTLQSPMLYDLVEITHLKYSWACQHDRNPVL